jgi:hypothetical protein
VDFVTDGFYADNDPTHSIFSVPLSLTALTADPSGVSPFERLLAR